MLNILIKIILLCILLPVNSYAFGLNPDGVLSGTMKTLARGYVLTMNVESVKAKHLKLLAKMDEVKFHKQYLKNYCLIKDLPAPMRMRWGLTEHMTKQECIQEIQRIHKKDLFKIINEMPDRVVAYDIKFCLKRLGHKENPLSKIGFLFKKLVEKV